MGTSNRICNRCKREILDAVLDMLGTHYRAFEPGETVKAHELLDSIIVLVTAALTLVDKD